MTEEKKQSVGERLLQLRNQKGMTQEGLAEYLDVSRQSVSKWELNKTLPDVEKLIQLSELYGVSIDYLVKGERFSDKLQEEESTEKRGNPPFFEEISSGLAEREEVENGNAGDEEVSFKKAGTHKSDVEYSAKKVIFMLAMLFSGSLCVSMIGFTTKLFCRHVFSFENKEHDFVVINKIYEQYTKAEVWSENEGGDYSRKTVWLDVPGVREEDFVDYYTNKDEQGSIFFEYYGRTLVMSLIVSIVLLMFTIIFGMGWRMTTNQKEGEKHGKEE